MFPFERVKKHAGGMKYDWQLKKLEEEGWPRWQHADTSPQAGTLSELIFHLRNATAHNNIAFSSDSRFLDEVRISFVNDPRNKPWRWEASIQADDLLDFCRRYAGMVAGYFG